MNKRSKRKIKLINAGERFQNYIQICLFLHDVFVICVKGNNTHYWVKI